MPLAPLAYNNSNAALLTPPVVSQGAVAYGVTSGPLYGPSLGSGIRRGSTIRQPEPRVVTFTLPQRRSPGGLAEIDRPGLWLRY